MSMTTNKESWDLINMEFSSAKAGKMDKRTDYLVYQKIDHYQNNHRISFTALKLNR